jgi:hypothetical protein
MAADFQYHTGKTYLLLKTVQFSAVTLPAVHFNTSERLTNTVVSE